MARFLFWLLLAVALWFAWRQWQQRRGDASGGNGSRASAPTAAAPGPGEPMVPCALCGLNVPRSEARRLPDAAAGAEPTASTRWYCSDAHRQAASDR